MSTFVHIKKIDDLDFGEVEYFSVQDENLESSEFERFLENHMDLKEVETEFGDLMAWLERLGEDGAEERYFRLERLAQALPPNLKLLELKHEKQLRLCCLRLSDRAVFLFNGGIKTTKKAQDCKNVSQYFHSAQQFCRRIQELITGNEIYIDAETQLLTIQSEGFYL